MNTKERTEAKKLVGKTTVLFINTNKRRSKLASEPNYHSTKYISEDLLIMEMKKTEVKNE